MNIILRFGDERQFFIIRENGNPYSPSIGDKFKLYDTTFIINDIYWELGSKQFDNAGYLSGPSMPFGLYQTLYMFTKEDCSLSMIKKLNELKFKEIDKSHALFYKEKSESLSGEMSNFGSVKYVNSIIDDYNFLD